MSHMSASLLETQYQNTWSRIRKSDMEQSDRESPNEAKGDIGCLVAREDDGTIVGLAHWLDLGRSWKVNKEVYLEGVSRLSLEAALTCDSDVDLFVLTSARGKGYGKQLILAVAAEGTKQGSDAMHWTTGLENVWSARMYDRIANFGHRWYSMELPYKPGSGLEEPTAKTE